MSDGTQAVLLDSNAYFRLGVSIRPLLKPAFGSNPKYSLYVLSDLDNEYRNNNRLQHKFDWVRQQEYVDDRTAKRYAIPKALTATVDTAFGFLADYADSKRLSTSRVDLKALAVGIAAGIPVVADDGDMSNVAKAHNIECWSIIKLLKVMVSAGRIDMDDVTQVLEYLEFEKDLPMPLPKLRSLFNQYFKSKCPI